MIRLRIERFTIDEIIRPHDDCVVWFEDGQPVGRVIIEELPDAIRAETGPYNGISNPFEDEPTWVPVEVIDEERKS
jgi:hypothetical protein